MIAKLVGIVDTIDNDHFILLSNSVGYQVFSSSKLLLSLKEQQEYVCYIQTIVKEDSITLFGFSSINDKKLFNLIITVQGVGPKIALLLIGSYSANEIVSAIINNNTSLFHSISGIGTKVAQRIVTELKDKIKKLNFVPGNVSNLSNTESVSFKDNSSDYNNIIYNDVLVALTTIGYSEHDVKEALEAIKPNYEAQSSSDIIKESLKFFASRLNISNN